MFTGDTNTTTSPTTILLLFLQRNQRRQLIINILVVILVVNTLGNHKIQKETTQPGDKQSTQVEAFSTPHSPGVGDHDYAAVTPLLSSYAKSTLRRYRGGRVFKRGMFLNICMLVS